MTGVKEASMNSCHQSLAQIWLSINYLVLVFVLVWATPLKTKPGWLSLTNPHDA